MAKKPPEPTPLPGTDVVNRAAREAWRNLVAELGAEPAEWPAPPLAGPPAVRHRPVRIASVVPLRRKP
jgi:hypothetical protein